MTSPSTPDRVEPVYVRIGHGEEHEIGTVRLPADPSLVATAVAALFRSAALVMEKLAVDAQDKEDRDER